MTKYWKQIKIMQISQNRYFILLKKSDKILDPKNFFLNSV
jgi:hypothetical protein